MFQIINFISKWRTCFIGVSAWKRGDRTSTKVSADSATTTTATTATSHHHTSIVASSSRVVGDDTIPAGVMLMFDDSDAALLSYLVSSMAVKLHSISDPWELFKLPESAQCQGLYLCTTSGQYAHTASSLRPSHPCIHTSPHGPTDPTRIYTRAHSRTHFCARACTSRYGHVHSPSLTHARNQTPPCQIRPSSSISLSARRRRTAVLPPYVRATAKKCNPSRLLGLVWLR